jgi:phosphosulfolactate synthase (CoM biosynthesis protein A)
VYPSLFPEPALHELIDIAHSHDVYVSTGGWMEHLLRQSDAVSSVDKDLDKCKDVIWDVAEISGFLSLPPDDWLRLCERVMQKGLKPKPELGIQCGASGDTEASGLESMRTSDPSRVINIAKRSVGMGVERMMIESEGITRNAKSWRTDVITREFGVYVKSFVDYSGVLQLSCLRRGIWGMADTFGKITTYRPGDVINPFKTGHDMF